GPGGGQAPDRPARLAARAGAGRRRPGPRRQLDPEPVGRRRPGDVAPPVRAAAAGVAAPAAGRGDGGAPRRRARPLTAAFSAKSGATWLQRCGNYRVASEVARGVIGSPNLPTTTRQRRRGETSMAQ